MSGAAFLNFCKAFDLVHHDILLKKLSLYNLSMASITFLQSYLQGCLQCVLVNGTYSQEMSTTRGVPQGSILSPLLFCIFVNDLPMCLTRTDIFKTSFSFSGSLAWNSLPHHLRYLVEVKTFKRKAFHALTKPPWYVFFFIRQTPWHKIYCIFPPCMFLSSLTFVFHKK